MLTHLDDSVGAVVRALESKNMLKDSIIIFSTDNGGPAEGFNLNAASNWPLRGVKNTLWEGGVRGAGLIWSPLLKKRSRVSNQTMHIADWLPTLYSAAGGSPEYKPYSRQLFSCPSSTELLSISTLGIWMQRSTVEIYGQLSRSTHHPIVPTYCTTSTIYGTRPHSRLTTGRWSKERITRDNGTSGMDRQAIVAQAHIVLLMLYKVRLAKPYKNSSNCHRPPLSGIFHNSSAPDADLFIVPITIWKFISELRAEANVNCTKQPTNMTELKMCKPMESPCLFNVRDDPCEQFNLADRHVTWNRNSKAIRFHRLSHIFILFSDIQTSWMLCWKLYQCIIKLLFRQQIYQLIRDQIHGFGTILGRISVT